MGNLNAGLTPQVKGQRQPRAPKGLGRKDRRPEPDLTGALQGVGQGPHRKQRVASGRLVQRVGCGGTTVSVPGAASPGPESRSETHVGKDGDAWQRSTPSLL